MPTKRVESYSAALLRTIQRDLGDANFFTREDLLNLEVFRHVSTIYRYHIVCICVHFLVRRGEVVAKNRTNLCLSGLSHSYNPIPLNEQYYNTISGIIRKQPGNSHLAVMDIVALWQTDPHITVNNKRVAVRTSISKLCNANIIRRLDDFEFKVVPRT